MPEQRKFPPPWTVEEGPACFIVRLRIFGDSDFNPKLWPIRCGGGDVIPIFQVFRATAVAAPALF